MTINSVQYTDKNYYTCGEATNGDPQPRGKQSRETDSKMGRILDLASTGPKEAIANMFKN